MRTEGCYVYDERGKRYIDFLSGWCVGNFGWGNSEITKRPQRRRPDYINPEYLYRPWVELARLLADITPGGLEKSYRATGGSEAADIALRSPWLRPAGVNGPGNRRRDDLVRPDPHRRGDHPRGGAERGAMSMQERNPPSGGE